MDNQNKAQLEANHDALLDLVVKDGLTPAELDEYDQYVEAAKCFLEMMQKQRSDT